MKRAEHKLVTRKDFRVCGFEGGGLGSLANLNQLWKANGFNKPSVTRPRFHESFGSKQVNHQQAAPLVLKLQFLERTESK